MPLEVFSHGENVTDPTLFIVVSLSLEKEAKKTHTHVTMVWAGMGEKWNYKDHIFILFDLMCFGELVCASGEVTMFA